MQMKRSNVISAAFLLSVSMVVGAATVPTNASLNLPHLMGEVTNTRTLIRQSRGLIRRMVEDIEKATLIVMHDVTRKGITIGPTPNVILNNVDISSAPSVDGVVFMGDLGPRTSILNRATK